MFISVSVVDASRTGICVRFFFLIQHSFLCLLHPSPPPKHPAVHTLHHHPVSTTISTGSSITHSLHHPTAFIFPQPPPTSIHHHPQPPLSPSNATSTTHSLHQRLLHGLECVRGSGCEGHYRTCNSLDACTPASLSSPSSSSPTVVVLAACATFA